MQIKPSCDERGVYILIAPDEGEGKYTCIRTTGRPPKGIHDPESEIICEGRTGRFEDRKVIAGREYYYCYRLSAAEGQVCGPFSVFPFPSNVEATPMDGAVLITCSLPPGCSSVRIERDDVEIHRENTTSVVVFYEDGGATVGRTSSYRVTSIYPGGREASAAPVEASPMRHISPPRVVSASIANGIVTAEVSGDEPMEIYTSSSPLKIRGLRIRESDLKKMANMVTTAGSYGTVSFPIEKNALKYLYPAIPYGEYRVIGRPQLVSTHPEPSVEVRPERGYSLVIESIPDSASGVLVKCDSDANALSPEYRARYHDQYYSREDLSRFQNFISLGLNPGTSGYVRVFAAFENPSGGNVYSAGVLKPLNDLVVKYRVSSANGGLVINFTSDDYIMTSLPTLEVRAGSHSRTSGDSLGRFDVQMDGRNGSVTIGNCARKPIEVTVYTVDGNSPIKLKKVQ